MSRLLLNFIVLGILGSQLAYAKPYIFKTKIHKQINNRALVRVLKELKVGEDKSKLEVCKIRLNRSQSWQDYFLPSKSKAHFDNCAFQKSINYINRVQSRNENFANEYREKLSEGEKQRELDLLRRKILFNSGKIAHATQDFYSHSNFLSILQEDYTKITDVPVIEIWKKVGQNQILKLQKERGLISGKAWWVFPKKCGKNSPTHARLAKDSLKYDSGKKNTRWRKSDSDEPINGYEAAVLLAEESTYGFLLHTFTKYSMLKSYCGSPTPTVQD